MVIHRPDFIVIGAMKSATTTLHEQLARQPGFFMSRPKEPNFFSDDENYGRGGGGTARFSPGQRGVTSAASRARITPSSRPIPGPWSGSRGTCRGSS